MNRSLQLKLTVAGTILVVVLVAIYFRLSSDIDDGPRGKKSAGGNEKPLERARNILGKDADLASCRLALQKVNAYLTEPDTKQPPTLSASQREDLRRKLGLEEGELEEVEKSGFTKLDDHYLELCLQLRDAVRAMELRSRSGRVAPQVEAAAAFAWVVRQVQLSAETELVPDPLLVLRRGFGSPLIRAVLFLGLLDQLGHDGCLLAVPGEPSAPVRYWACGVRGEDGQIYLFDPRLGIALPGPHGKGIATLAEAGGKDSPLQQLDFGPGQRYDVTPEQAASSEVHLVPLLPALAPRMRFLEQELQSAVRVRLAADPAAAERFVQALKANGNAKPVVKRVAWAARLQRRFLPDSDGGTDQSRRREVASQRLGQEHLGVLYSAFPKEARPPDERDIDAPPYNRVFKAFVDQFTDFYLAPGRPRDLLLRGQYAEAGRALGPLQEQLEAARKQYEHDFEAPDAQGPRAVVEWVEAATRAHAALNRDPNDREALAAVEDAWKRRSRPLGILLLGATAKARLPQISYEQGLCRQELAERLQYRLEHFPKEVTDQEINQAENSWTETAKLWEVHIHTHGAAPPAQRFRARAEEKLADVIALRASRRPAAERPALEGNAREGWEQAGTHWGDLARETRDKQALAYRYQAKRLEEKWAGKD